MIKLITQLKSWMIEHVEKSVLHVYRTLIVFYHNNTLLFLSLSHRQNVALWNIQGRGIALRVRGVFKQHRVLTSHL